MTIKMWSADNVSRYFASSVQSTLILNIDAPHRHTCVIFNIGDGRLSVSESGYKQNERVVIMPPYDFDSNSMDDDLMRLLVIYMESVVRSTSLLEYLKINGLIK